MTSTVSYPRLAARTRNFTLGRPRDFTISPDGERLIFLRSGSGTDPSQRLWAMAVGTGDERCLVDPSRLGAAGSDESLLPPEERARRERAREQAGGIVQYNTDDDVRRAVFTVAGQAWVTEVDGGATRSLDLQAPVVDPRIDPAGQRVAWVHRGSLRVTSLADGVTRTLAGEDDAGVTWGLAEFIAAEEMGRTRGFWWSPDGDALLVARVDTRPVQRWWIAHPVNPEAEPQQVAYPAAGTPNADVSLHVVGIDGGRQEVSWDRAALPYLASVHWQAGGAPLVTVQSRNQQRLAHLAVDAGTGDTHIVFEQHREPWIDLTPGVPRWYQDQLVTVIDDHDADARRLAVNGAAIGPHDLHVREVLAVEEGAAVVRASWQDPTAIGVWRMSLTDEAEPDLLSEAAGVSSATMAGNAIVLQHGSLEDSSTITYVLTDAHRRTVPDVTAAAPVHPNVTMLQLGPRNLQAALLRPTDVGDDAPLPVLLDPYGGPHAQRVLQTQAAFRTSQWFADQGFAVLVVDGRGTPGRGLSWEHAVHGDLAHGVLEDQVTALHAAADHTPLDLSRVAIRGWSFGGYLAALAVLQRPDVFHAAIAGAPVTEWRLYDTHYTERYLGDPDTAGEVYDNNSLLPLASRLERPLLLIHGLADDNVVAAHTLRLSQALLESGRPHQVLPLSGVTHMTPQEVVAENLMLLQAEFLREALRS